MEGNGGQSNTGRISVFIRCNFILGGICLNLRNLASVVLAWPQRFFTWDANPLRVIVKPKSVPVCWVGMSLVGVVMFSWRKAPKFRIENFEVLVFIRHSCSKLLCRLIWAVILLRAISLDGPG